MGQIEADSEDDNEILLNAKEDNEHDHDVN